MKSIIIKIRENICLLLLILALFFQNIYSGTIFCPLETPILKSGNCSLEYCTDQQFATKTCIIANPMVETKWINNFIIIAPVNYRCLSISSFSNGDMVIATTRGPKSSIRALMMEGHIFKIKQLRKKAQSIL